MAKVSVLFFYRRIFAVDNAFLLATRIIGALVVGYLVSAVCGLIFADNPVEAQWKVWLPHTSIEDKTFWTAMGIINVLLDFSILCMPQPLVWKLHLTTQRKILLSLLFFLGGL
jgi:xanthine/uracil permease